jgi:RHS repeat-associated protein
MMSAQDFAKAVDSLTGQVAFSLPLLAMPGPASLPVSVSLGYNSAVADTVQHWNLTNPTGVAGLGWTLPRSAILAGGAYGADLGDRGLQLMLGDAVTALIPTSGTTAGGDQLWLAVTRPFWQVSYAAAAGTWTVIDENGIAFGFGRAEGDGPGATEYAVALGDWIASSNQIAAQSQVPIAWNLATVTDLFANECRFFYEVVDSTLTAGGLSYAQASYLTRIEGAWGDVISLSYVEKASFEYALPYTLPDPPNAYQARLETRALQSAALIPADRGAALITVELCYATSFNAVDAADTAFNKRTLTKVTIVYPDNDADADDQPLQLQATPPLNFTYVGIDSINPGALDSVTVPEGAVVTYSYGPPADDGANKGLLQYSDRASTLVPPVVPDVTFSLLRFLFVDADVVALWSGSDNSLVIVPYRWEGRWLAGAATSVAGAAGSGLAVLTASSADLFGVLAAGTLYSFSRDPRTPDGWITGAADLTSVEPVGTNGYQIAVGDRFIGVLCEPSGSLFRIDFASLAWTAPVGVATGVTSQSAYGLAAQGNKLLLAGATGGGLSVWLDIRDARGNWTASVTGTAATLGTIASVVATFCTAAAAFLATGTFGAENRYATYATAFGAGGALGALAPLAGGSGAPDFAAAGMTVQTGMQVARYDGKSWIAVDLDSFEMPEGANLGTVSLGQDVAARSLALADGGSEYQLIGFDANTGTWAVQGKAAAPASGTGVAVAPSTPVVPCRYAVLGASLYYMNSDLAWSAATDADLPKIDAADATSVQVLSNDYLLYQSSADSTVTAWFLSNGTKNAGAATAQGASLLVGGQAADFLVGQSAFVTYAGTWNGADMVLTLHRPVTGAIAGQQTALVVESVSVTSGYANDAKIVTIPGANVQNTVQLLGDSLVAYSFATQGATTTPDGLLPLFNVATVMPRVPVGTNAGVGQTALYLFNGLSRSETPVEAFPSDSGCENSQLVASLIVGIGYLCAARDSSGSVVSRNTAYWWGTVTAAEMGFTTYARQRRAVTLLDGVSTTINTTYNMVSGYPDTITGSYVDGAGATVATTQSLSYVWEKYPATLGLNILAPIVETVTTATSTGSDPQSTTLIGDCAVTWRQDWGMGVNGWAPAAAFRRTSAQAIDFDAWDSETAPAGWQQVDAVKARSRSGLIIEAVNIDGVMFAALADRQDRFVYASAFNANTASLSYYGCEPYEGPNGWSVVSGGSLATYLTAEDAHTGTTSLRLPADTPDGQFVNYYQPGDTAQTYVFGCWTRSPGGFDASGTATATFTAHWSKSGVAGQGAVTALTLSSTADTDWRYLQTSVDFTVVLKGVTPDNGSFYCEVLLANANDAGEVLLDELRLTPMAGAFAATVIDTTRWLPTATINTNGQSVRTLYDAWLKPIATIGPDDSVLGAGFTGLSRQIAGTGGGFDPCWPNTQMALSPGGAARYDDFHTDTTADWTFVDGDGTWSIGDGVLGYAGTPTGDDVLGGTATPKASKDANFAARILVHPAGDASPALGDGTIFLRWDSSANSGQGQFALVACNDDGTFAILQVPDTTVGYGADWLFIAVDGFYTCAIGGIPVFSYIRPEGAPDGACLTLAADGTATFDSLIRFDDPGVAFNYFDAQGRPTQQIDVIGGPPPGSANAVSMQVATWFHDSFGRPVVAGRPQTGTLAMVDAQGTALPSTVPATGGTAVAAEETAVQTLPDGSPIEYLVPTGGTGTSLTTYVETGITVAGMGTQLLYDWSTGEASPLGRPLAALPTRSTLCSNGTGYQRAWSYQGLAALPSAAAPPASAPLLYRQSKLSAQTSVQGSVAVTNVSGEIHAQDGRLLQRFAGTPATPTEMLQSYTYTLAGQVATATQANAADPPAGTTVATWTQTYSYDFLGRLISGTSPDAGTTQYAYDSADRLRFYMDADGAAASPQRINYIRYDSLGRPVEQGWIDSSAYGWGSAALTDELDDQDFPNVPGGTGAGTAVSGRWRSQLTYDTDGNATTLYLLGQIWQAKSQPDTGSDGTATTRFYNAYGRVTGTTETVTVGGIAVAMTTGYSYTPAGRIASVTYPALDPAGFTVGYYYDRLGRPAAIGDTTSGAETVVIDPATPATPAEARYAGVQYGSVGQVSGITFNEPVTASAPPAFTRNFSYSELGQLTVVTDPYMQVSQGYVGASGATSSTARLGSTSVAYQLSNAWPTPPTPFGFTFGYDDLGRLTSASPQSGTSAAFGFLAGAQGDGTQGYDANGNRLGWNRGVTTYTGSYPTVPDGGTGQAPGVPANGLTTVAPGVSETEDFADAGGSTAGVWSWGSNNGGLSTSGLIDADDGNRYLRLGGGNGVGHYEVLVLDTWLEPTAALQLTASLGTDSDYSNTGSRAVWTLTLYGPAGAVSEVVLQYVPAGSGATVWATQTVSVDVAGTVAASGYAGQVTRARLALQNMTRGAVAGSAGAAVYVQSLTLNWPAAPRWAYGYDHDGNVTSQQELGLSAAVYDFLSNQATETVTASATQSWLRDSAGRAVAGTVTTGSGATATTATSRDCYDLSGNLIARSVTAGGTTSVSYFVNGPGGMIAAQQDGQLLFTLTDPLGSVRTLVDGATNGAVGAFDYQPFGGIARVSGNDPRLARFTGHDLDPATGLILTPARLLESATGRFLQVDPINDGLSPYAYVWNDPVNLVDPSGMQGRKRGISAVGGADPDPRRVLSRTVSDAMLAAGQLLVPVAYHMGQYAYAETERAMMRTTGVAFAAEHVIGMAVLVLDTGLGRTGSGWSARIENLAHAYQVLAGFHRGHVGTGTRTRMTLSGFNGASYRATQRSLMVAGLMQVAFQINSLGYAVLRGYQVPAAQRATTRITLGGGGNAFLRPSDLSFFRMLMNAGQMAYAAMTAAGDVQVNYIGMNQLQIFEAGLGYFVARTGLYPRFYRWHIDRASRAPANGYPLDDAVAQLTLIGFPLAMVVAGLRQMFPPS